MAKSMKNMDMSMMCAQSSCGPRCIISGVLAAAAAAAGLWMLVAGVMMQSGGQPLLNNILWYAGGFLLWGVAKCIKMKACSVCRQ